MNDNPLLTDPCELDYPPAVYGNTPDEVVVTVEQVIERIFRDDDGAICSGVNGRTMKPLTLDDIHDRPYGIGTYCEQATMPVAYRSLWLNYENMLQTSGKHLQAMVHKHAVTGDGAARERAVATFDSLHALWNNTAEQHYFGRGWMPKPYAGIRKHLKDINGSSVDQYTDTTLGLHAFYRTLADCRQKTIIEDMVLSFADFWIDHDYTCEHVGGLCQWWIGNPPLATAWFLYLFSLADRFSPRAKYRDAYAHWLEMNRNMFFTTSKPGLNTSGLVMECLEQLIVLRPEHHHLWHRAADVATRYSVERIDATKNNVPDIAGLFQNNNYGVYYMTVAHRMRPGAGYDRKAQDMLARSTRRSDFYHVMRGQPIAGLSPRIAGDDYRNTFWAEDHCCWLGAYWALQHIESSSRE